MKKIFSIIALLMISDSSLAVVNFSTYTNNLAISNVSIDGGPVSFDSVILNLNLKDGTFAVVEANRTVAPIATFTEKDFKVDLQGCTETEGSKVSCVMRVESLIGDVTVVMGVYELFDNFGRRYGFGADEYGSGSVEIDVLGKSSIINLDFKIIRGVPVEVKFIMHKIAPGVTSISLFKPQFINSSDSGGGGVIKPEFKDIPIIK